MCGITGIINFTKDQNRISDNILKNMTDVIVHRGPDSEGQWISESRQCGLGFRRLSIIDLSEAGNQPMHTPDGRYTIVFNGEIYNHADIRKELENKGCQYKSGTDTETILYGFMEYGTDILQKMIGMWAIAIWDEREKRLFCSRDRIGIKPFYYYFKDGVFVFGSEIKSIIEHPDVSVDFNIDELPNYLNYAMTGRDSFFKDIHKLAAGHMISLNADADLSISRYWSFLPPDVQYTDMSQKEIQDEILRLLRMAIKDRMMSDVPFGVFLSGGIDSSVNVALMAELMDRPVDTFTVGFRELEKYNELKYARQISELFNTNHHEILIDDKQAFPILEQLPWVTDEPNSDPVCIPLYFLSKLTRDSGTTVIQVGEGSDEQFVGYTWMLRDINFHDSYWKYYKALPSPVKKAGYHMLKPLLGMKHQLLVQDYIRRATYGDQLYWGGVSIMSPSHLEKMLEDDYQYIKNNTPEYAAALHKEAFELKHDADFLQRIAYVELSQRLSEILLMRVDKIGMAHSIEARVPFLDHRLVEFTMSIPPDKKIPDKKATKMLLKNAVKGILPDNIIHRKKQGFWAPVNEWIGKQWFSYTSDKILNSSLMNENIFNREYIKGMLDRHQRGRQNLGLPLFSLLSLTLWYERFFGNKSEI